MNKNILKGSVVIQIVLIIVIILYFFVFDISKIINVGEYTIFMVLTPVILIVFTIMSLYNKICMIEIYDDLNINE